MATAVRSMVERRTVRVGAAPHRHIAYSGPTRQVWVLNTGETSLSVLDGASAEPIGKVDLGGSPRHVILDDAAGLGYVSLAQDALAIVDIRANRLLETLSLPRGSRPGALQPMFGNRRLYVLLHGSPSLAVVDTRRNALAGSIPVGRGALWGQPWGSSYKPITRPVGKAYIANADSDDVTLFDDATDGVIARVAVGRRPSRNAIYRERGAIYVANALDNTVSAIRIADDTVAATVPVGTYPFRLLPVEAVNGRDELWVLNAGSAGRPAGEISVVSGREHRVLGTIPVVDRPANWLINTAGLVFVVSATARELCVVDVRAGRVVGSARLSRDPHPGFRASGLVFSRSGSLFVLNADATVSRFTAAS